jgi:serine/threonine protein kinase
MLCGQPPWDDMGTGIEDDDPTVQTMNIRESHERGFPENMVPNRPHVSNFISRLLTINPRRRLGASGAREVCQHPWFFSDGFNMASVRHKKVNSPFVPEQKKFERKLSSFFGDASSGEFSCRAFTDDGEALLQLDEIFSSTRVS